MNATLSIPTAALITAACQEFDREHALAEETLRELFDQFPQNDDLRHVLLKVVAVNSLCPHLHSCDGGLSAPHSRKLKRY